MIYEIVVDYATKTTTQSKPKVTVKCKINTRKTSTSTNM